jgi:pimeloyl-ACP methyl ester carboxylesterase
MALEQLGVKRALIAGHSMGGGLATALGEAEPELVEGLVVVDTPPDADAGELPFAARLGFVPVLGEAFRRVVSDGIVRDNLESAFADGFEVPDQFVSDFRRMTYSSYDGSHQESDDYGSDRAVSDRLAQVGRPLLVIFGTEDELVDVDSASDYRKVPGSRIKLIPGAGHSPMVEKPDQVSGLITDFERELSR